MHLAPILMIDHSSAITDRQLIKKLIRHELDPTWSDMTAYPDLSWVIPLVTEELFIAATKHTNGNQTKAAKMLGISRGHFRCKQDKFKLKNIESVPV
ncbi:hypothetical protein VSVS05_04326 (plasmid) [Vibrio scophthalmi]|uniref:DNA binding HTH domain-containing protein n=2 Tax=Vibrio scophthalmi TaxID=45658 RepID=A0A1C7FHF5_9VIBR|nr:hypothetical protein VSVS05_04326 [Vibrio scophthalmi]